MTRRRLPTWLTPCLVPLAMLFVVIAAAIASWLVVAVFVVLGISVAAVLAYRRLRYVKDNPQTELRRGNSFLSRGPSEPELRHKNFWDLS